MSTPGGAQASGTTSTSCSAGTSTVTGPSRGDVAPRRARPSPAVITGARRGRGLHMLYCLERRDEAPPPLDPLQVRIVVARLKGAASIRELTSGAICASGGMQYNAAAKGLYARSQPSSRGAPHLRPAAEPIPMPGTAGTWRRWISSRTAPAGYRATEGVVDFRPVGQNWLREDHRHRPENASLSAKPSSGDQGMRAGFCGACGGWSHRSVATRCW